MNTWLSTGLMFAAILVIAAAAWVCVHRRPVPPPTARRPIHIREPIRPSPLPNGPARVPSMVAGSTPQPVPYGPVAGASPRPPLADHGAAPFPPLPPVQPGDTLIIDLRDGGSTAGVLIDLTSTAGVEAVSALPADPWS